MLLIALIVCLPIRAATFTVDTTTVAADAAPDGNCATASGACRLHAALMQASGTPALDTIQFNIPGADPGCSVGGACTILASTPTQQDVLEATQPIIIDDSTQPGNAAVFIEPIPDRPFYQVALQRNGNELGLSLVTDADHSTIRGLNVRSSSQGLPRSSYPMRPSNAIFWAAMRVAWPFRS